MKITIWLSILVSLILCQNVWAAAVTAENWDKRFTLRGGGIYYDMSGEFSSTKDGQSKVKADMDDLNLEENEWAYTAGATLRLGERWRIRLDYFGYHDSGDRTLAQDIEFEGVVYPVGGYIDSKLDIDLYVVNLSYDLYQSDRARFGIGIGAHIADFELNVSGTATVSGVGVGYRRTNEDLTAPLPNLYAGGIYAFRDDLLLNYGGGWMSLTYGDYDGDLVFARAALEYWPHKNVGFGAGYSYISVDVDYDSGKKKETYDVDMPGPLVYLIVGF